MATRRELQIVQYIYLVTNPGDVPLTPVTLGDNTCPVITGQDPNGDSNHNGLLDPGEACTYICAYTVQPGDPAQSTNLASAQATDGLGGPVSGTAQATVAIFKGRIGDLVWNDSNANGTQDPGEMRIYNIPVTLIWAGPDGVLGTSDDVSIGTRFTDLVGHYQFDNLPAGLFEVQAHSTNALLGFVLVSGTNPQWVALTPGEIYLDADFGYQTTTAVQVVGFQA